MCPKKIPHSLIESIRHQVVTNCLESFVPTLATMLSIESYLKAGYLKKQFILVSFLIKYNIIPTSTKIELYLKDVGLLNMILEWHLFNVASIMHSIVIQWMGQAHDYI